MRITPDFSEAVSRDPIADGIYHARIIEASLQPSKKNPTESYIKWKLELFGAEGDLAKENGKMLFYNTMITGKGAGMLKDLVHAATGKEIDADFDTDELLGQQVTVTLKARIKEDGTADAWPDVKAVKAYMPF